MAIHGDPCRSLDAHANQWILVENNPWILMTINGDEGRLMKIHDTWTSMEMRED